MFGVSNIANTGDNRQYVCRCLMDLIDTLSPNSTAIGILPGLCGVSLGFHIHPNTDCSLLITDHCTGPYNRLISTAWPEVSIQGHSSNS
ncbi:unnamed protein product [Sphenostylis stenocarpa]|uniref:Uncharacterized protein n=1 Tax=Sphenostylis stenocarpa TaxID=92480 RepID=A0AA86W2N0_9FABA|nr:unnamed protein product [Sphenostylis stenocarpa]